MGKLTAEEAREIYLEAREKINNEYEKELDLVLDKIGEAARQGKSDVNIDGSFDEYIILRLKELGYTISSGSQYNDPYLTIMW